MPGFAEKLPARGVKPGRFVLIHVHKGIVYAVRAYGTLEAAVKAGRRLAKAEGFNEEDDEVDVWKAGDSEASWQYRGDDSFPAPGEPRMRWR